MWYVIPKVDKDKEGSNFWRDLCSTWDEFLKLTTWRLGSGHLVEFNLPLLSCVESEVPMHEANRSDFLKKN